MSASSVLHKFFRRNFLPSMYSGRTVYFLDKTEPYLHFSARSVPFFMFCVRYGTMLPSMLFLWKTRELSKIVFNITSDTENFVLDTFAYNLLVEYIVGGAFQFRERHKLIEFQNKLTRCILELVKEDSFGIFEASIENDSRKIVRLQKIMFSAFLLNVVIFPLAGNFHAWPTLWKMNNIIPFMLLYVFWTTGLVQRHFPRLATICSICCLKTYALLLRARIGKRLPDDYSVNFKRFKMLEELVSEFNHLHGHSLTLDLLFLVVSQILLMFLASFLVITMEFSQLVSVSLVLSLNHLVMFVLCYASHEFEKEMLKLMSCLKSRSTVTTRMSMLYTYWVLKPLGIVPGSYFRINGQAWSEVSRAPIYEHNGLGLT